MRTKPRHERPSEPATGKRRLSGVPLLIVAIGVVLFVQALFVLSYVDALHHPKPHDVAVGVVGASPVPIAVGEAVLAEDDAVRERIGRAHGYRSANDRRSVRRRPEGRDVDRGPGGEPRGRLRAEHSLRGRRCRVGPEDGDRSGSPAPARRRRWDGVVPRRDGPHRRRVSLFDHRDGVRRTNVTGQTPRVPGDRRRDRSAPHGHARRAGTRMHSPRRSSSSCGRSSPW